MIQTSARLLKLLSLLQSRRFWSGGDLAVALRVTERSIRRDVDRLRSLGYPVHATGGVGGGYQLGAGKELPPLPFEDEEAVAMAVGLRIAATGPVCGLGEASLRALIKLEQVLPKRLRRKVHALEAVSVRMHDLEPLLDVDVLTVLTTACRDAQTVELDYSAHDGTRTTRRLEPYRLVHTSRRWYLLAYDLDRQAWRTLRVDRVGKQLRVGSPFKLRPLPAEDVAGYVSQAVSTEAYRYRARVTVFAPAESLAARVSAALGRVEPISANRCELRTGSNRLSELALFLGTLEVEFEVHEPPELIDYLHQTSKRLERAARGRRPRQAGR